MSILPLQGLRVTDLTIAIAGPTTTLILGDMGAEIIKVEAPWARTPEGRVRAVHSEKGKASQRPYNHITMFNESNRSKLGIVLDMTKPEGQGVFKRLVRISDIVVENYSPRVMKQFGLDYPALKEINSDIIMASMPAFGDSGPYRDYTSFGPGTDAMSGLSSLTGYLGGPPLKPGNWYADLNAGFHSAFAILAAVRYRRHTGKGQYINVAMREVLTHVIGDAVMDYTMNGRVQTRMGNRHSSMAPHGCYRCQGDDKWVTIAIGSDEEWERFCHVVGNPQWAEDDRFADVVSRWNNQDQLDELVESWTSQHGHYEVMNKLQAAGIAAGAVLNVKETMEDPHVKERNLFQKVVHPEAGAIPYCREPWQLSRTPVVLEKPAPCFGQHNEYIFGELLGLTHDEIEALYSSRVSGREPVSRNKE